MASVFLPPGPQLSLPGSNMDRNQFTEAEKDAVRNFAAVFEYEGPQDGSNPRFRGVVGSLTWFLIDHINRYGGDGMGDKPKELCRVAYWLQHLKDDRLAALQEIAKPTKRLPGEPKPKPKKKSGGVVKKPKA